VWVNQKFSTTILTTLKEKNIKKKRFVKVLFAFAPKHLISAQIVSCVPVFG
jgi:hypothetical protein